MRNGLTVQTYFFDNVGVQMIKAKVHLHGELYLKESGDMIKLINDNRSTKIKMTRMIEYLSMPGSEEYKEKYKEDLKVKLQEAKIKLEPLTQNKEVILLGGYKGGAAFYGEKCITIGK